MLRSQPNPPSNEEVTAKTKSASKRVIFIDFGDFRPNHCSLKFREYVFWSEYFSKTANIGRVIFLGSNILAEYAPEY